MNVTDEDAIRFLKVFSFLGKEEIEEVARQHFAAPGERIGQKKVAYEVTKDIHGKEAADEAVRMSEALFSNQFDSLSEKEIEEVFGEFKRKVEPCLLEDLLITLGAASSKREARTFITGNSVSINGKKVTDPKAMIDSSLALHGKYAIVKRGKKNYYLAEF